MFLASITALCAADAPTPVGDWHGKLSIGPGELRVALHVQQAAPGQLKATLDSLDQGANGIPAEKARIEGTHLTIDFPVINGVYEAEVSADGKSLVGNWTQNGNTAPLKMVRGVPPPDQADPAAATAAPLAGTWEGVVDAGSTKLRVRLNLTKDDKGSIRATLDSIDQNVNGMPVSGVALKAAAFHFEVRSAGAVFDGTVDEKQTTITGSMKQAGANMPLVLKKAEK